MLVGEPDGDIVVPGHCGVVLDGAGAVPVVSAHQLRFGRALDGQAKASGTRSWKGEEEN